MTNEEVIKQLKYCKSIHNGSFGSALKIAIKTLERESKTGHWIEHDRKALREMGYYRCSECNHGYQRYERGVRKSEVPYINGQKYELHRIDNYCPNCGAKMQEVEE